MIAGGSTIVAALSVVYTVIVSITGISRSSITVSINLSLLLSLPNTVNRY